MLKPGSEARFEKKLRRSSGFDEILYVAKPAGRLGGG